MPPVPRWSTLLAGLALVATQFGPHSAEAQPPRVDAQGNPLPDGAVIRLGSLGLRQLGNPAGVAFSADGKSVVAWGSGGLHVADVTTGRTVLETRRKSLLAARFAPDGNSGVAVTDGGTAVAWDVTPGREEKPLFRNEAGATAAAFSPDGKLVAFGVHDGSVHVRDATTGKLVADLSGPKDGVRGLALSADGKLLARAGEKSVGVWDVATDKETRLADGKRDGSPFCAAFSPDGRTLVTGEYFGDVMVRVWDVATGKERYGLKDMLFGYFPRAVAFAPDGKAFAHTGEGGVVFLRKTATGEEIRQFKTESNTYGVAFSPDGRTLAAAVSQYPAGGVTRLYDVATGKERFDFPRHEWGVEAVFFSPDGKRAVTSGIDRTVRVWDADTGKQQFVIGQKKIEYLQQRGRPCALSPDGKTLLAAWDAEVGVWDVATGKELRRLPSPAAPVLALAFAPSGKAFAALCIEARSPPGGRNAVSSNAVHVIDLETGKASLSIRGLDPEVSQVQVSANGSLVAVGAPEGRSREAIALYDATGRKVAGFLPPGGVNAPRMVSFALSPDERTLAASGDKLRFWDTATGELKKTLDGPGELAGLVYSPNGRYLAGSDTRRWCVFEAATGKVVWERKLPLLGPAPVAFSADGSRLRPAARTARP